MELYQILIIVAFILLIKWMASWWKVAKVGEAYAVATPKGKIVVSTDPNLGTCKSFFNIPHFIPLIGREARIIATTIQEIIIEDLETYEKQQGRFAVNASVKYRVKDVRVAAETFTDKKDLEKQLIEVIESSVRAVTVKHDVVDARAMKKDIEVEIKIEMDDDFGKWGLELISVQLVNFKDTSESKIISNISLRREKDIEATTRRDIAEKDKDARIKEADANEIAKKKEIDAQQAIDIREQEKVKAVNEKMKESEEKRLDVVKTQTLLQQDIDREQAIIKANEDKATAEIRKEQKRLEGEGERLRLEEIAKGTAASTREELLAEADGKAKLQEALSKFDENAIRAMVAQDIVQKDKEIGIELAKSIANADLKIYAGDDKQGFDIGKLIAGIRVADSASADALLNRIAKPNDLGFNLGSLTSMSENDLDAAISKVLASKNTTVDPETLRSIVFDLLKNNGGSQPKSTQSQISN